MKLGLIARGDFSGLAVQTWEFYRHMQPNKVMLIDVSQYANEGEDCNKFLCPTHHYQNVDVHVKGWEPTIAQFEDLLDGLDAVYSAETPYGWDLVRLAQQRNIRTYIHINPEFCQHLVSPYLIKPTLLMNPTSWLHDRIPATKQIVPFPVALKRFPIHGGPHASYFTKNSPAKNFLHVIGRPAAYDRNGTVDLLRALEYVRTPIRLTLSCLQAGYIIDMLRPFTIPDHIQIVINELQYPEYWSVYEYQDVMIMPRRWGGMSLPIQEALGAGMPVIISANDVYSKELPPEWAVQSRYASSFQARTRIEVHAVDVRQLADRIDAFATNDIMMDLGMQQAIEWGESHSWKALKPLYDEILAG